MIAHMRRPPPILDQRVDQESGSMRVYASASGLVKSAKPAIATRSRSAALVNEQESLGVEPLSLAVQERGAALARRRQSRTQASDVRLTRPQRRSLSRWRSQ
jgi:hypothetical protein